MGKKAKPATSVSTPTPYAPIQPGLQDLATAANQTFQERPPAFTGELFAGPTQTQLQSVDMLKALSERSAVGEAETRQLGLDTIAGKYMMADSNPYLRSAVDAAIVPITQQLQRSIIPGIQDKAQISGAYGGSRQGIMEGVAAADWAKSSGGLGAQMYSQNYQLERDRQMKAPALLEAATALGLAPANLMREAGQQEQSWAQSALDADRLKYELALKDQWAPLANYSTILGQYAPYAENKTVTTGGQGASGGAGGFLSGAAGGAAAGAQFGPWGAGIGGVIGGLGGLFG